MELVIGDIVQDENSEVVKVISFRGYDNNYETVILEKQCGKRFETELNNFKNQCKKIQLK